VATRAPSRRNLLFRTFTTGIDHVDMPFDRIMPAIDSGEVDAA